MAFKKEVFPQPEFPIRRKFSTFLAIIQYILNQKDFWIGIFEKGGGRRGWFVIHNMYVERHQ